MIFNFFNDRNIFSKILQLINEFHIKLINFNTRYNYNVNNKYNNNKFSDSDINATKIIIL